MRNRSLSDARWFYDKKRKIGKGNLYLHNWKSIKLKRNMLCYRYSQLYVSHMCKRTFRFKLQLSSYWQNINFSRNCPIFYLFTVIVIFQVYLQLLDQAGYFYPLNFMAGTCQEYSLHFCQLWAAKMLCACPFIFLKYVNPCS